MSLFALIVAAIISCAWFLLSLRPGSALGFAFTSGDWLRSFRESGGGAQLDRALLWSACRRSLFFHLGLAVLLTTSHVSLGVAVASGILLGCGILFVTTRVPTSRSGA